ncbi:SDR family NAD(P)-dependent oxidoreductase [Streptomyces sp. NPDC002306]
MRDILTGNAVVTGAASGIGRAVAVWAAQHGAKAVVIADLTAPLGGGALAMQEIEGLSVPARFVRADVTERLRVDDLVAAAGEFA